jgi:hypothetical protein
MIVPLYKRGSQDHFLKFPVLERSQDGGIQVSVAQKQNSQKAGYQLCGGP